MGLFGAGNFPQWPPAFTETTRPVPAPVSRSAEKKSPVVRCLAAGTLNEKGEYAPDTVFGTFAGVWAYLCQKEGEFDD